MLDNEAVQALASPAHPKHRLMLRVLEVNATRNGRRAGSSEVVVPTAVRVEAGVDRRSSSSVSLTRLRVRDVPLDTAGADRAAALRRVRGSAIDACVADVASQIPDRRVVVLTADLTDIPALLAAADASHVQVRRL